MYPDCDGVIACYNLLKITELYSKRGGFSPRVNLKMIFKNNGKRNKMELILKMLLENFYVKNPK